MTATGPRCHCGTKITHTPGKRPRVYCSDRCRKAAKRAIADQDRRKVQNRPEANPDAGLGTSAKTTVPQVTGGDHSGPAANPDTGRAARDDAYRLRDDLQDRVSQLQRLIDCGRKAIAGAVALTAAANAAGWRGVATCGSVHVCPVCAPAIRRVRAAELQSAGAAWESVDQKKGRARGVVMVTLTMRHYRRQKLRLLVQRQGEAWKRSFGQNALRTTKAIRRELGVVGYVRAWETTYGPNGWHVHYHVVVFLEERPTPRQVRVMERLIYSAWSRALERVGAYRPSEAHGVRVDAPGVGEAGTLAMYLMKSPDGRAWTAAQEAVRGDAKEGRAGHRTPFQIARGAAAGDQDDIELWREYEAAATGIRSLYWSQGLRALLRDLVELDDRGDTEVAAEETAPGEPVALFPPRTWYGHVVRHRGRRLELIHAAERWGQDGVRTLTESWGLLWGVDVLEPEKLPEGAAPTAAELLARMERAELAARADVWRREFDRIDREERAGRIVRQTAGAWTDRAEAQAAEDRSRTREMTAAQKRREVFLAAHRLAKKDRAEEIAAALERVRSSGN